MFRLGATLLTFMMADWIFFHGEFMLMRLVHATQAGAGALADLVFHFSM